MSRDRLRTLERRHEEIAAQSERSARTTPVGADVFLGQTTQITTYPTQAQAYYAVEIVELGGAEVEGGAGDITGTGEQVLAYNTGSAIPPSGTLVVVTEVPHRFVFHFDG